MQYAPTSASTCCKQWLMKIALVVLSSAMNHHFTLVVRWTGIMSVSGGRRIHTKHCSTKGIPQKLTFSAQCPYGKFMGRSFSRKETVNGITYLRMLQNWLLSQLQDELQNIIFQQGGARTHFLNGVREWMNDFVPYRWIGRHGPNDLVFLRWPPRSPTSPRVISSCGGM
jgi:hypothetical protein